MTTSLWPVFTDCIHPISIIAVMIHELSLVIDPSANHHTDTVLISRMRTGPGKVPFREGFSMVLVLPEILARVGEVCPQADGEPLVERHRLSGVNSPVEDTGMLRQGLQHQHPTTKQSRINNLINSYYAIFIILLALVGLVSPGNVLRHHEVLVALHPWVATGSSAGVLVVTHVDPISLWLSSVGGGQAGGIGQGQGGNCDGGDGVHLSYSSDSVVMINTQPMLPFISSYRVLFSR